MNRCREDPYVPSRTFVLTAHCPLLRESCLQEPYGLQKLGKDILAGATVGVIAIPLAMALAIASGVAPQFGLYTAIIAGF